LRAFVIRDFRLERSYRLAFVTQIAGAFTTVLSAGFLSHLVPGQQANLRPYGGDYFTFALVGTAALSYFSVALGSFSSSLGEEQRSGTLESLLASPNQPRVLLVYGAAWPFIFATAELIAYTVVGAALFGAHISFNHIGLAAGMLLLTIIAFSAVGLAVAGVLVLTKRAGLLIGMIGSVFAILGGVLYPVSVLPGPLRLLAQTLPMSRGLDGMRRSLTAHPDLGAVGRDAIVLVVFALLMLPLALAGFEWAVNRARRHGSLSHY
jgi:ABC-2 type transport system permease protein